MSNVKTATPAEIKRRLDAGEPLQLIDVREEDEIAVARIHGAKVFPMSRAASWIDSLPGEGELVILCHHGMRSMQVAMALIQRGHTNVTNMTGGIDLWSTSVDSSVPRY